ncbi:MAG: SH3 domain-containing protein [Desulfuromonadaceae bacterium]|nr:SH3 domain-containing protein [Desulfuromonadaceae bacterium]MDD2855798.1 SH3 domain-containing protein [Desulfuromonadaceae bacterium]
MAEENKGMGIGGLILVLVGGAVMACGWVSINGMILLDRFMFTRLTDSPLIAWSVAGVTFGTIAASGKIISSQNRSAISNIFAIVVLVMFLGIAAINWQRTEQFMAVSDTNKSATTDKVTSDNDSSAKSGKVKSKATVLPPLAGGSAIVISETANVREEPSVSANSEYYLDKGEVVQVLSEKNNWCRVRFSYEGKNVEGWVSRKLLTKEKES